MTSFKNAIRCRAGQTATTTMSGATEAEIGAPVEYGGRADTLNPEELLVASINSCLMLVFYHFAEKSGLEIASYEAEAEGTVEKTRNGLRFTGARVETGVKAPGLKSAADLEKVAQLAETYCLVSNAVNFPVSYRVTVANE